MKKINVFLLGVLVAFAGFVSSCTKEEDPNGPQISFSNDQTETTLASGVTSYELNATITSVAGLDQVKVFSVASNGDESQLQAITSFTDKTNFHLTYTVSAISAATTIKVSATDKNNVTNSKNFVIKVAAVDYATYSSKLLYDAKADNSSKTFFSSQDGNTYTSTEVAANKSKIDFGFLYDQEYPQTKACLISLDEYSKSGNYTSQLTGTLNATSFKSVTSATTYDNAASAAALKTAYDAASALSTVGNYTAGKIAPVLAEGNVVAFKTAAGKYGLIKIGTVTRNNEDANNGQSMVINVKVQN